MSQRADFTTNQHMPFGVTKQTYEPRNKCSIGLAEEGRPSQILKELMFIGKKIIYSLY